MRKTRIGLLGLIFALAIHGATLAAGYGNGGGYGGGGSNSASPSTQACVNGGTISNGGTVTPNFSGTNCYVWTVASGASFSMAAATNLPTLGIVYLAFKQAATGTPTITWPGAVVYNEWTRGNSVVAFPNGGFPFYTNSTNGYSWSAWFSDGTNLTLLPGSSLNINAQAIGSASTITSGTNVVATTTVLGTTGIKTTPAALSAFGTCNAGAEGTFGTQSNSTAACVLSATATSAGTIHCAIYCNGTNWIQLGF
jgi:hypothetical protein